MLKSLNIFILSIFMLSGIFIPMMDAKGATLTFEETEEQALSMQVFEEEVHHESEDLVQTISSFETNDTFPIHINLTQQLVYSDDPKPPML